MNQSPDGSAHTPTVTAAPFAHGAPNTASALRMLGADASETRVYLRDPDGTGATVSHVAPSGSAPGETNPDDRYQFIEEIAHGGMGVVYRLRDTDLGRDIAVKVLAKVSRE